MNLRALVIALSLVITPYSLTYANEVAIDNAHVMTLSGALKGEYLADQKLYRFLGIPYAQAQVGEYRFKAPRPTKPWGGTLQATTFGPASAQAFDQHEGSLEDFGGDLTNEDSLSLNIWTPSLDKKRPVMVWIHGGGNAHGSSRSPNYNGANLAKRGDVVFVSINYRLGIFGFIDMSLIGGEDYTGSANNGIRDQMMALKWIRENIEQFGGDPDNITAMGNSAGATNLSAILGSKKPKQYFDRVVLQSGAAFLTRSPISSARMNKMFFENMGITHIDQLLHLPAEELIRMQEKALNGMLETDVDLMFQPTMDSEVVEEFPLRAIRNGATKDIDMLIGSTANELMLYTLYDPQLLERQPEDLPELQTLPWIARKLISTVFSWNRPHMQPGQVAMDIFSDLAFRLPAIRMAEAQSMHANNAWLYRFDWPIPNSKMGAPHAIELPFLFNRLQDIADKVSGVDRASPEWRQLAHTLQDAWINFAHSGNPTESLHTSFLSKWQPYNESSRSTLLFNTPVQVVEDPSKWERRLFSSLPFDGYFDDEENL